MNNRKDSQKSPIKTLKQIKTKSDFISFVNDLSSNYKDLERVNDLEVQDIVVLNLQRAVQVTIDMASYIVSVERLGTPKSLKDLFLILEQNKLIDHAICAKMQKMVEFQNIAVHDYQVIDPNILKSIISLHLKDFEGFYEKILKKYP